MNIKHTIWNHEGSLYKIHRAIPESQMHHNHYGINSNDVNKIVKVWAEWLRHKQKSINKVFQKSGNVLFCERIEDIEYEEIKNIKNNL